MRLLFLFAPFALLVGQPRGPVIDNEYVRVLSVTDAPAPKPGAPHEHKQNRVMIYLDSGDITIRYTDGRVENQHWKPGDVAWSPAGGVHTSQNVSDRPVRIIEIELKNAGTGDSNAPPDRTRAIIDNPQVRAYRDSKPAEGKHYLAVDIAKAQVTWDRMPEGSGPFVITELK